jgi:hypothetical protein
MLPAISWLTERPVRAHDSLPQPIRQTEMAMGFGSAIFTNLFLVVKVKAICVLSFQEALETKIPIDLFIGVNGRG